LQDKSTVTKKGLISWALYDWANSGFPAVIQTFVFAAYFIRQIAIDETTGSAQWGYAAGIAGLVIALAGPIFGAISDQGGRRKPWILFFTGLCVIATALLWFAVPDNSVLLLSLILVGLGIMGSEFAFVFYNAMLPDLVPGKKMGRWSGWGWGFGYAGGLACLIIALFGFVLPEEPIFSVGTGNAAHVRATFVLVAIWYFIFSIPLFVFTPDRPATRKPINDAVRDGIKQFIKSIQNIRKYKDIVRFLFARMLFIDGLATVFAFGGVYAAGTFGMDEQGVMIFGIGLNITAGLGAAMFAWLDDRIGSRNTILYALSGLILTTSGVLFVTELFWFWVFGLTLGVFVGPVQAASRTLMGRMAPEHMRTEMFGLLAFSGKATSFAGPLAVGALTAYFSSQRMGMLVILAFFLAGFGLMFTVPKQVQEFS